ncbi:MAG: hypothetical protein IT326_02185 [Anaerolineae bacterium]|nr:hypothetical protein [Anaerolineae bacterium]
MSRKSRFVLILALVFAGITGVLNVNTTEVIVPMSCLLIFSFVCGLVQPKGAWRWGILIGLSIMISTFVGLAVNFQFPEPPPRFPITAIVLVIPALIGAYTGAFIHRVFAS